MNATFRQCYDFPAPHLTRTLTVRDAMRLPKLTPLEALRLLIEEIDDPSRSVGMHGHQVHLSDPAVAQARAALDAAKGA